MFTSQRKVLFETPSSIVYERKFDTALRDSLVDAFLYRRSSNQPTEDDRYLLESTRIDWTQNIEPDPSLYAQILSKILHDSFQGLRYDDKTQGLTKKIAKLSGIVIDTQLQWMLEQNQLPNKLDVLQKYQETSRRTRSDIVMDNLLTVCSIFQDQVEGINKIKRYQIRNLQEDERIEATIRENYWTCPYTRVQMVWSHRLIAFCYEGTWTIHPISYLLMIHNKLADLLSVLFYARAAEGNALEEGSYKATSKFVQHLCTLSMEYKNRFYDIAKTLEAICIGTTLTEVEEWDNYDFLNNLAKELKVKTGYNLRSGVIQKTFQKVSIPFRHELSCLSKIVGHPYVDMVSGTSSLHKKTTEHLTIDPSKVRLCTHYVKQNYIKNYIVKHHKWPLVELTPGCPNALIQACLRNLDPDSMTVKTHYGRIPIDAYGYVDLKPSMKFEKLENFIPYLKDKTISILRTQVMDHFIDKETKGTTGTMKTKWADVRLLLVYLLNPSAVTNHVPFLDRYTNCASLEELLDYLVIRVVPKEKELKVDYRGFGCKTMMDRSRALAQEKNVKFFEELYMNESAMAIGEIDLNKKLMAFRRILSAYKGYKVLRINVDASSWNNRFRDETVRPVMAETLDKVFDYPIFSRTHEAFEHTLFYVDDEIRPAYWDGQLGGIEGLNQDTWVVTYIGQIKVALQEFDFQHHILCKGDDLRVIVLIPPTYHEHNSMPELKARILDQLQKIGSNFGHTIKVDDSYGSESYFAFSKSASVGTIELPQVFRKIQKCYGANNAFLPSLDEFVGSTFSNAHSAARTSTNPIACYTVALFWMYFYLLQTPWFKDLSDLHLATLALVPSLAGGFPIIYMHNMFVRAESDLLTPFIGLIQFCTRFNPPLGRILKNFAVICPYDGKGIKALLKDPYCLNIKRPQLPSAFLRLAIIPALRRKAQNEMIKELFNTKIKHLMKAIHACFESFNVYTPRVMSSIYASTPEGILDQLLRKFETSRSVLELLILTLHKRSAMSTLRKALKKEKAVQTWRANRLQGTKIGKNVKVEFSSEECPCAVADRMREASWGKPCQGVTMAPFQHLLYIITPHQGALLNDDWVHNNHFLLKIIPPVTKLQEGCSRVYQTSDKKPFLGHSTSPGTIEPLMQFIEKDVVLLQLKNLLELRSWTAKRMTLEGGVVIESNIELLIDKIISFYATQDVAEIAPFAGIHKSGTLTHHIRAPKYRESIVPNELSNIYQQVVGESNAHQRFRTSGEHYTVNFLHVLCYLVKTAFLETEFSRDITTPHQIWGVTIDCPTCSAPIRETPMRFDEEMLPTDQIQPLRATRVGAASERVLLDSYAAYLALNVRKDFGAGRLSREEAFTGVMQLLVDYTVTQRHLILNRFTQHSAQPDQFNLLSSLAPKSRMKEIGQREIKATPLKILTQTVINQIYLCLITRYTDLTSENVHMICNGTPGTELPWYGLVDSIYRAGRLGDVVRQASAMAKMAEPSSMVKPSNASQALGPICFRAPEFSKTIPTLIILSFYEKEQILEHVKTCIVGLQWTIFNRDLKELLTAKPHYEPGGERDINMDHRQNQDYIIALLTVYILFTIPYTSPDYQKELMIQLKGGDGVEAQILMIGDYTPDLLPTLIELNELVEYKGLAYIIQKRAHLRWDIAYLESENYWERACAILSKSLEKWKLRIRYSDPSTVIAIAREHLEGMGSTETDEDIPPPPPKRKRRTWMRDIHPTPYDHHMMTPPKFKGQGLAPPEDLNLDWPVPRPMIDLSVNAAIFGNTNYASTKIVELWSCLGIFPSIPDNSNISCLADGIGGFTEFFCSLFYDGQVVACCLPEESEVEVRPESALSTAKKHRHTVHTRHILGGISDLSDPNTLIYLESLTGVVNLVSCDADTIDWNSRARRSLQLNVVTYYLKHRQNKGVLIMKLFLREFLINLEVIELCTEFCPHHKIAIIKLKSSIVPDEVYLFAQGSGQQEGNVHYSARRGYPSAELVAQLTAFTERVWEDEHTRQTDYRQIIEIRPALDDNYALVARKVDCIIRPLLQYQLGLLEVRRDLKVQFRSFRSLEELKNVTWLNNSVLLDKHEKRMRAPHVAHERGQAWDSDTLTHALRNIEDWLSQCGYFDGRNTWVEYESVEYFIPEGAVRHFFMKRINAIPRRFRLNELGPEIFEASCYHLGVRTFLYAKYVWGFHLALLTHNTWRFIAVHDVLPKKVVERFNIGEMRLQDDRRHRYAGIDQLFD